mgnify:CR=1 FL=1
MLKGSSCGSRGLPALGKVLLGLQTKLQPTGTRSSLGNNLPGHKAGACRMCVVQAKGRWHGLFRLPVVGHVSVCEVGRV